MRMNSKVTQKYGISLVGTIGLGALLIWSQRQDPEMILLFGSLIGIMILNGVVDFLLDLKVFTLKPKVYAFAFAVLFGAWLVFASGTFSWEIIVIMSVILFFNLFRRYNEMGKSEG